MRVLLLFILTGLATTACAAPRLPLEPPRPSAHIEEGVASWYGPGFHGRRTASGEVFDQTALTAAHPTLAFGTRLLVVNLDNGREVEVRINDRGPFVGGRIIDVSHRAAELLGMVDTGTARVRLYEAGGLVRIQTDVQNTWLASPGMIGRRAERFGSGTAPQVVGVLGRLTGSPGNRNQVR
jgi:rare lipoprotein A